MEEDGSEASDPEEFFGGRNGAAKGLTKERLSKSQAVLPSLNLKKSVSLVMRAPGAANPYPGGSKSVARTRQKATAA